MLPRRYIEAYLFFLLRHRWSVIGVIAAITAYLLYFMAFEMRVYTNFFDLYPPRHPYIQLYTKYRHMFGTANVVQVVVEVQDGDLFTDPETIHKVDRITLAFLHEIPGVNPEQVISITHPKVKTALTAGSGIKVVPLTYPRLPETKEDLEFLRQKVYTTEGVRGLLVSPDDKATQIVAGFWEEYFDLVAMWAKIQEIVHREEDARTKIYVTGFPVLYAYFMTMLPSMKWVLLASIATMIVILWYEFHSWQGVWIPVFSGTLSAVWGLGFGGLCGLTLDPLVLVVPLLISARAHSHSVQSMERYHEEYHRLGDRDRAIVKSYTELFAPAIVAILSDSLAILTLVVAHIPVIQKLAILTAFWVFSIFVSVVTLHPIILSFVKPPSGTAREANLFSRLYDSFANSLVWLATGWRRSAMAAALVVLLALGLWGSRLLKVGNTTPGEALLYPDHPHNVAFRKVNEHFLGASQLVIIAEGKKREALKDAHTLSQLELFARWMEKQGAGGSMTVAGLLKKIFRTFHEGDPKWNMLPANDAHVGQIFFLLTAGTRRGEMDRFFDLSYTNATITLFYRNYNHDTIQNAIAKAKQYIAEAAKPDDTVRYLLAGGLLGILAAVNEEVEWSYRVNLALILTVVFLLSYLTYRSVVGALIVMLPSLIAQPLSEAVMYLLGIDMNVNSLPVAAVGIGIGIDYGYYVLSRIVEEYERGCSDGTFDEAIARALHTTGKTVLFTGLSLTASIVYWVFFPMKFQAEMALLLTLLLGFHLVGALMFIPPMVNLLRPRFAVAAVEERREQRRAERRAASATR
jgi:predicted RND superfamily exporter protein